MSEVTIIEDGEGIYLAERALEGEYEGMLVRSAFLLGEHWSLVLDTLTSPEDMAPIRERLAAHGRPILVVNTHADWDHAWGNIAFTDNLIIGHRLCAERLRSAAEILVLSEQREASPGRYENVALVPPALTFEHKLEINLGGMSVHLQHLPGHTADCLLAYVPERRWLFAGDCAEDPIPYLHSGPLDGWIAGLRSWAAHPGVETVVPAHGAVCGIDLLRANADYLDSLRHDGPAPEIALSEGYIGAHESNKAAARRLAEKVE